jgi:cell division protein FtsL
MNGYVIIATALATVILLIIIVLSVGLLYYRWRTTELLSGMVAFVRQNQKLEDELNRLTQELKEARKMNRENQP